MLRLVTRAAAAEDALGMADLFKQVYTQSSHPCKEERFVADTVASGATLWKVAVVGERVVGCMAAVQFGWNRSWEIARGVVHPDFRTEGLGAQLCQQCLTAACESESCDVVFGFVRSNAIARITFKCSPSLLFTGHDCGINVANAAREYHGFVFARNPRARFRHYIPRSTSLAATSFVREKVFSPLGLSPELGEYPPVWLAGDGVYHPDLKPFSFGYNPFCPSDAIEITGYFGMALKGRQVAAELSDVLDSFYHSRHARLAVLVDKTDLIENLVERGFEVTAYLPAWCSYGDDRFDCILMARTAFDSDPGDYGLREIIDDFRMGLSVRAVSKE